MTDAPDSPDSDDSEAPVRDPQPVDNLDSDADLARQDKQQDLGLKILYARAGLIALGVQILIADAAFFLYGDIGVHWKIPASVIDVWLGATVVQVVGVVLVITRYLFPRSGRGG